MTIKLTPAQRDFLVLAAENVDGNPWPSLSMRDRTGGSKSRMADQLVRMGFMRRFNEINETGRAIVADEVQRRAAMRSPPGGSL